VWLEAADPSVDESKLVGEECTLTVMRGGPGALVRHINGVVSQATIRAVPLDPITPDGNLPRGMVELVVMPVLWTLSQRSNNRVFQNKKAPDILKEVLDEGLKPYGRKVTLKTTDSKYAELEYCTQYDETDLDFVQRLMATEGIMSYFKQSEKDEELILFDDASNYMELVTLDHAKVSFEANQKGTATAETVSRFRMGTRMTPTSATVRFFNWSAGGGPDETPESSQDPQGRDRELYCGESPVTLGALDGRWNLYKKTSAASQVKLIQQTELAQKRVARGHSVVTGMTPGMTFELDNALRDELNQEYLVVGVTHHGRRPGDGSKSSFAGDVTEVWYSNTFSCVPKDVLFRLSRPPRRAVQTLQTAIVVGDEDVTTDPHGRIKVQFHWDRKGRNDIRSSCWIRVAQSSAGTGFGAVFIPRKGQEVVVSFLEGDPDKPLVIGSVYNGTHLTPYDLTGQQSHSVGKKRDSKTRSVIRTGSTPDSGGYNEISFEDARGSEELYIQAQKDRNELVKHDHELYVANNEVLHVGDDSKGGTTTDGNRTRSVKKDETIDIGGNRSKTVKLDETIKISGNRILDVTKTSSVTVGDTHDMMVTKKVTETYKADHTRDVTGQQSFSAKSKKEHIEEAYELNTDKKFHLEQGATTLTFADTKVTLEAGGAITIKRGGAKVVIDDNGNITADTSGTITLKSGASKAVLAAGEVVIKGPKTGIN